jgi:glycosyltransferase involved in cell wall biosynthesis
MHWPPNADGVRWFVHEVWPLVRSKAPQARFIAVGKAPPEELANSPGVTAPGYVDDPATYWNDSNVFVVPLRAAGGMRVKILDAWGRGLPVISTTIGAEGIACTPGRDILIADQPGEFAQAILAVLDEPLLSRQIRDSAWQTVSEKYDWRSIYQAFDQVYC